MDNTRFGELFSERLPDREMRPPLLSITREEGVIPRDGGCDICGSSNEDKSKYQRICR